MKVVKIFIGIFVLCVSIYIFSYLMYKDTTFILVYHRISNYEGGRKSLYVSPKTFENQMKFLYKRGYKTISLDELKYRLKNNLSLKKMFCITFDDGYEDLLNVYPVLKKYGFKATVYIHTNAVKDGFYSYPGMVLTKMISFQQLKKIMDVFEIGSHTVSHPDLTKLSEIDNVYEIKYSKEYIEKELNVKVKHFCYPFGKVPLKYKEILRNDYETAVTLNPGLVYSKKEVDFYLLPRVEWKEISSMSFKDFVKNLDFYIKIFFGV